MIKERLKAYRQLKKESEDLERRIEARKAELYGPRGQRLDGMPRGGSGASDTREELIESKDELLATWLEAKAELDKKTLAIEKTISVLGPRERRLIRLYYFDGLTWEQVCVEMAYSWTQVHRIHGNALEKLKKEETEQNGT